MLGAYRDRLFWMALLITACFVSVLLLRSQSAASYPSYFLTLLMLLSISSWIDVLKVDLLRWVLVLIFWLGLSAFWSSPYEGRETISIWVRVLLIASFVIAFAECQLRGQLQRWMASGLAVVGLLAIALAILNFFITDPEDGRLNGLGQLDTHVIAALVYGVVMVFALQIVMNHEARLWRVLACGVILLGAVAVWLSDSRNAWVSVGFGCMTYVLANVVKDRRQFIAAVFAGGVVLAVALVVLSIDETTRDLLLPRGDSFRLEIWSSVWARVVDGHLLFGLGAGTPDNVVHAGNEFLHPHSMYLSVLYQGGLVALFLYLVVLIYALVVLFRNLGHADAKLGIAVLAIAGSAHMLDGHELVDKVGATWFLVWLPVAIAVGLRWRESHGQWRMES